MLRPIVQTRASKIKSKLRQSHFNSRLFVKRIHGLDAIISRVELRDTYLVMQERMDLKTRTCYASVRWIAERRRLDMRTIRRHIRALRLLGVVLVEHRKYACRSNYTNRYTFPVLDESFVTGGGDTRVRVKQILEIEKQTTTARDAEASAPRVRFRPRPENHGARMSFREAWSLKCGIKPAPKLTTTADFGTQSAWDRANGGLSWEERNPEEAEWFARETAKLEGIV
jgi:hypothetical protein